LNKRENCIGDGWIKQQGPNCERRGIAFQTGKQGGAQLGNEKREGKKVCGVCEERGERNCPSLQIESGTAGIRFRRTQVTRKENARRNVEERIVRRTRRTGQKRKKGPNWRRPTLLWELHKGGGALGPEILGPLVWAACIMTRLYSKGPQGVLWGEAVAVGVREKLNEKTDEHDYRRGGGLHKLTISPTIGTVFGRVGDD